MRRRRQLSASAACRPVPWRRRDGVLWLAEAHDNDAERAAARGPRHTPCDLEAQRNILRTQSSPHGSGSIQARWWSAQVLAKRPTYSATRPMSLRACRPRRSRAPCLSPTLCIGWSGGLFVVEDRGTATLKGIERPVQVYRVVQPSAVRGRLEAVAATRGLTLFVGREDELRLLMNRWEHAVDGQARWH